MLRFWRGGKGKETEMSSIEPQATPSSPKNLVRGAGVTDGSGSAGDVGARSILKVRTSDPLAPENPIEEARQEVQEAMGNVDPKKPVAAMAVPYSRVIHRPSLEMRRKSSGEEGRRESMVGQDARGYRPSGEFTVAHRLSGEIQLLKPNDLENVKDEGDIAALNAKILQRVSLMSQDDPITSTRRLSLNSDPGADETKDEPPQIRSGVLTSVPARFRKERKSSSGEIPDTPQTLIKNISQQPVGVESESARKRQSGKYESFDYEIPHNRLQFEHDRKLTRKDLRKTEYLRWLLVALLGLLTGIAAYLLLIFAATLTNLKLDVTHDLIKEGHIGMAYVAYTGICLAFALIAALFSFWAPESAGSGIPQVKGYLNGNKIPGMLRLKVLIAKFFGIVCCVSIGTPAGREGPMVHIGSIIAAGLATGRSQTLGTGMSNWTFNNDHDRRDFVSAGAASGVAAAFNAPIGGILFSLEEVSSFWSQALTWRSFFSSIIAATTVTFLVSEKVEDLGLVLFGERAESTYELYEVLIFALMGAVGGLVGALYNKINQWINIRRRRIVNTKKKKLIEVVVFVFLAVTVLFWLPQGFDCTSIKAEERIEESGPKHHISIKPYDCDDHYFNDMATLILSPQESVVKLLFARETAGQFRMGTLVVFLVVYFTIAVTKYGVALPSGLFVPTLLLGAVWGRLIGEVLNLSAEHFDPGTYALVGAAAMLGGVTRMTISLTVIIVEITNDINFLLPIMVTIFMSKVVGDKLGHSLYDIHIELMAIPYLEADPPDEFMALTVADVMERKVVMLNEIESLSSISVALQKTAHQGFPVVDRGKSGLTYFFSGIILRSQLEALVAHRVWELGGELLDYDDYNVSVKQSKISETEKLTAEDMNERVDLRPYIEPSPFVVQESLPLVRAFRLFRSMGMRHMCVVDARDRVVGIVTRKDLLNPEVTAGLLRKSTSFFAMDVAKSVSAWKSSSRQRGATRAGSAQM